MKVRGINYKKIGDILVPVELVKESLTITEPHMARGYLAPWMAATQETVLVLTLNGHHQHIKTHVVTLGLANQSQIHPREVFRPAIQDAAVSIMVAHNHPSGYLQPSDADLKATKRLSEAAKIIGIPLLDHLVFAVTGIYSIREHYAELF